MKATTLIIEDDSEYAEILARVVTKADFLPVVATSAEEGLELLPDKQPELVLLDIGLPGMNGVEATRLIKEREPDTLCIIVSGQTSVDTAVAAMQAGAFDYINKTSNVEEIRFRLARALEASRLNRQVAYLKGREGGLGDLLGASPPIAEVRQLIRDIAAAPTNTALIVGETGTGKELVARAIHKLSTRRDKPLVSVNCAAVPEDLLESEFFGHVRGAFTGADRVRRGLFELADGGTLFLDEIGELDPRLQAKLLRVVEDRTFKRVGGEREIKVDVRLISATNRDLEQRAAEGRFRTDLLYRVNIFQIQLPPLRERGEDILLLANHFIAEFNGQLQKQVKGLHRQVELALLAYPFPGNVRQLRNFIEQAMILAKGDLLTVDLMRGLKSTEGMAAPAVATGGMGATTLASSGAGEEEGSFDALLAEVQRRERELLEVETRLLDLALARAHGNKTRAAELLGISRYAFLRRQKRAEGG